MIITLKDGSKKEYSEAKSVIDIAYDISEGLARAACAGEVNGEVVDLRTVLDSDCELNMLTAKDEINDKVTGLDIGADDYITKPFAIQELLARIRATLRKHNNSTTKPAEEPSVFKFKNIHVYLDRHEVKVHNQLVELTKKEYDLLLYLLHNHDHVLSREQILQSIWGYEYMGDTNVVDVYIRYLRAKIDDYFNEKYIHTVRGIGYVIKT